MDQPDTMAKATAKESASAERTRSGCCYRPNVDIVREGDDLLVLADVPGAKGDAIDVKFENGALEIHAPVAPRQDDACVYLMKEYGVGDYYRSFRISEEIDAEKISADYADGVLTLRLPKAEAAKPRKIGVNVR